MNPEMVSQCFSWDSSTDIAADATAYIQLQALLEEV